MRIWKTLFLAAATLGTTAAVHAAPIYNSVVGGGTLTGIAGSTSSYFADSFTSDSSGLVADIDVALARTGTSTAGSFLITLYANSGTSLSNPTGTALATDTVSASIFSTQNVKTIVSWSLNYSGAANTNYWVEIVKTGLTTPAVSFYLNSSGPSIGGTSGSNTELYRVFAGGLGTNTVATSSPGSAEICVDSDGSCAAVLAPEPSGFTVLGIGLIGIGVALNRRRRPADV